MSLPWRCTIVPEEQWLGAGITSGLSDPKRSCQDKQLQNWRNGGGGSAACYCCGHQIYHLHAKDEVVDGGIKWVDIFYVSSCYPLSHFVDRVRYAKEKETGKACMKEAEHMAAFCVD